MNPFKKKQSYWYWFSKLPENVIHKAVTDFISLVYPDTLWIHVPSEAKRTPYERYVAKLLGLKPGVPDLLIFESTKDYHGLAIELKSEKGKLTDSQKAFIAELDKRNWKTAVCYDSESACDLIKTYMVQAKAYQLKMEIKRKLPKNVMVELIEAQSDYNDAMTVAFFEAEKSAGNIKEITKKTKNSTKE